MKTLLHPADTTGEKNVAFQWFLLVFSFTNACLMWLFFGICCIVSNDRLRGLLRLVVCVLFFFFFDPFVPVLKPSLLHGKCIRSPWGYHIYLSVFSLKMFCIQLCQFATMVQIDSIYITMSACCGWLQSGKARFGLSCRDGTRFF